MMRSKRPLGLALVLAAVAVTALATARGSDKSKPVPSPTVRAGKYAVTLRLPEGGLFAGEETQIEFRVVDASADDPVLGPPGVIRATIGATIAMPSMAGMPKYEEQAHVESVPGDYGIHPTFPHGGDYLLTLKVSPPADAAFVAEFPIAVKDADPSRPPAPKPFFVDVASKPGKPKAGEPAELRFLVRERANPKATVRDFDIAHTKLFHLMVVRKDLGVFAHEHPEQREDGSFALRFTFPTEGTYQLFADVAPRGRGSQVLVGTVEVKGSKNVAKPAPYTLAADADLSKTVDGTRVRLTRDPETPVARAGNTWTFTLTDGATGASVDPQPYLGAMGHLVLVHEDGETYVHSHPDELAASSGGRVSFSVRFPKPGLYRAWGQFQRDGRVLTADFVISVVK
jgi:hypothetical protein